MSFKQPLKQIIALAFIIFGCNSTLAFAVTPPSAPTGVIIGAVLSGEVEVMWRAPSGATSYTVLRSTVSGGPYTSIVSKVLKTYYIDSSVANGITYYYVVSAVNAGGVSPNSAQVSATPLAVPAAPTGLTIAAVLNGEVSLNWNATTGAASYTLLKSLISGGPYITVTTGLLKTFYNDSAVKNGTTYYYVVEAVNANHYAGPHSTQVSATPLAPPPAAPIGLTVTALLSNEVGLRWNSTTAATSYAIARSTVSGGPYTTIAAGILKTYYNDSSVTNGTTYYYVVQGVNINHLGGPNSAQVSATPLATPSAPSLTVGAMLSNEVELIWTASTGAASYAVGRSTKNGGPYTTIATDVLKTYYNDSSVKNGTTYYYVVEGINANKLGSSYSNQVSATPLAPPPAAPTGLKATLIPGSTSNSNVKLAITSKVVPTALAEINKTPGNDQVALSWNPSATAVSYTVKRSNVNGGPYDIIGSVRIPSFTDNTTVNGNTYYYVVSTIDANDNESPDSAQVSVTLTSLAPSVSATAGNGQVTLAWTASPGSEYYIVNRSTATGGSYAPIPGLVTNTTYTDTSLNNGTTYYYAIEAVYSNGQNVSSLQVQATPESAPSQPTGLSASGSNNLVVLSWNASTGATSYNVKRSTVNGGSYTTIYSQLPYHIYEDTSVSNNTTYYYVVSAINSSGESVNSSQVSATPQVVASPTAPTTVSAVAGNAQATVSFSGALANGSAITSYTVTSSPGSLTATGSSSPITVTGLVNGISYAFTVTATNSVGTSSPSLASNSATPIGTPTAPTMVSAVAGNAQATVSFSGALAYGSAITSYTVTSSPGFLTATGSGSPLTVGGLTNGTSYTFTVTATNSIGTSSPSFASNSVTPEPAIPSAPTGLSPIPGDAQVQLFWNKSSGATSYNVKRSTTNGSSYVNIATTGPTSYSYTDTSVANGTTYYYVVSAVNAGGESTNSNQVIATPQLPTPTLNTATGDNGQVTLSWTAVSGATSYSVEYGTSSGSYGSSVSVGNVTSYTVTGLMNGTTYYFVVTAGSSLNSNQLSAAPSAPSMARMKNAACNADGILFSTTNPDGADLINMMARSNCYFLPRAVELWNTVPNFLTIQNNLSALKLAAPGKSFVFGVFFAEAIPNTPQIVIDNNGLSNKFDFSGFCRKDINTSGYWAPGTCIPDLNNTQYQSYLLFLESQFTQLGIDVFQFGQVQLMDIGLTAGNQNANFYANMRNSAPKGTTIYISGQTNSINDPTYLSNFDFIVGGSYINRFGLVATNGITSGMSAATQNVTLLWAPQFHSVAKNIFIEFDWSSIDDDMHRFTQLSASDRTSVVQSLYNYYASMGIGFVFPFEVPLNGNIAGTQETTIASACYGYNVWLYSAEDPTGVTDGTVNPNGTINYTCNDEASFNQILKQGPVPSTSQWWPDKNIILQGGDSIENNVSLPANAVQLMMGGDGNLVLYSNNGRPPLWESDTFCPTGKASGGCYASMQADGNIVLYDKNGNSYWKTNTGGHSGASLGVSTVEPYLSVVDTNQDILWTSSNSYAGLTLPANSFAQVGSLTLNMQNDGNLVMYNGDTPLWASGVTTASASAPSCSATNLCYATLQGDGNLVVYSGAAALWASGTSNSGEILELGTSSPYLSISQYNTILWTSSGATAGSNYKKINSSKKLLSLAKITKFFGNQTVV